MQNPVSGKGSKKYGKNKDPHPGDPGRNGKSTGKVRRAHQRHEQVSNKYRTNSESTTNVRTSGHKGGGRRRRPPPLWGGRRPPLICSVLLWYFAYFFDTCLILFRVSGGLSVLFPYFLLYFFRFVRHLRVQVSICFRTFCCTFRKPGFALFPYFFRYF